MSASENLKKVMIVEDDPFIREAIQELLESEGYEVASASNGQDALNHLRSAVRKPGLIILDLMMPVMDGFTFRNEQVKDDTVKNIPVVVMSADGNVVEKRKNIGAISYLRKPVEMDDVVEIVRKACM